MARRKFSSPYFYLTFDNFFTILLEEGSLIERKSKMLVLSRKKDETILIKTPEGENIKITVVKIEGSGGFNSRVRIGIDAPQRVTVLRSELEKNATT
jgi:carbon storage regulator CsrA